MLPAQPSQAAREAVQRWHWECHALRSLRPAPQHRQGFARALLMVPASFFSSRAAVLQVPSQGWRAELFVSPGDKSAAQRDGPDAADRAGGGGLPGEMRQHPAPHRRQRSLGYSAPGDGLHDAHGDGDRGVRQQRQMPPPAAQLQPQAVLQRAQYC